MSYRFPALPEPLEPLAPLPPGLRPSWRSWPEGVALLVAVSALVLPAAALLAAGAVLMAICAVVALQQGAEGLWAASWLGGVGLTDVPPAAVLVTYLVMLPLGITVTARRRGRGREKAVTS